MTNRYNAITPSAQSTYYAYDVFLSHNHADKPWAHQLADRIADITYNGRPLRPWLDEQFLNPGDLSGESELTTALDRSRFFCLILTPASVASDWVAFELTYFLKHRDVTSIILIQLKTCKIPEIKGQAAMIDFRHPGDFDKGCRALEKELCASTKPNLDDVFKDTDEAFQIVKNSDPGGFDAAPKPERDAFFDQLSSYVIDDAGTEGLAINAFIRAAELLIQTDNQGHETAYNLKMLLGEALGAALANSYGYRQVVQRFVDMAEENGHTSLQFAVIRAYSKMAEIDPDYIDISVLLRIIDQLDAKTHISNEERALETLLGRILGKIRNTTRGALAIKYLSTGGRTSRIVAAWAIAYTEKRSAPVFYLSHLQNLYENRKKDAVDPLEPPGLHLLALYFGMDIDQDPSVMDTVRLARQDLERDYPGIDFPYGYSWITLRQNLSFTHLNRIPFSGEVRKVTIKNMEDAAGDLNVSHVACLTEPRIVDALFNQCGALLIPEQDPRSPQCRRLENRGIPFGMASAETMSKLTDGHVVIAGPDKILVWDGKIR